MIPTARAGLIIPSSNRMVEQEMVRWFPADVQAHVTRLRMTGDHHVPFPELLAQVREAAAALADAKCDVVAFHCTANSMENGPQGEAALLEALRAGAHERVTTTATAVHRALTALGAKRLVLVTPYTAAVTEHEAGFLAGIGYEVVAAVATDRGGSDAYCATPPAFWSATVRAARRADAEAYFISCANVSCFGEIENLERELDRPVISSNQVVVWDALRLTGTTAPPPLGRLFATLARSEIV